MAGKKGMKQFGAAIIDDVLRMVGEGKTHREISELYGFQDKEVIRGLIKRHNGKLRKIEAGFAPRLIGRPRKSDTPNINHDQEIRRLKMENELLRSFLLEAGRR